MANERKPTDEELEERGVERMDPKEPTPQGSPVPPDPAPPPKPL